MAEMIKETNPRARAIRELPSKAIFVFAALPALLRAALRLTWLNRRCGLDQLADRLRVVEPFSPSYLANPRYLDGSAHRLVRLLPPRGFGRCLKHSLLLLDLWSRCGLEPRLHIGTRKQDGEQKFHAWVTIPGKHPPRAAGDYAEIWSH